MYHNGHETASCTPNYDGVVDYFNEIGYDVMELMMPLIGCNQATAERYHPTGGHGWFEQFEAKGDHTMRYFIEPVALAARQQQPPLLRAPVELQGHERARPLRPRRAGVDLLEAREVVPDGAGPRREPMGEVALGRHGRALPAVGGPMGAVDAGPAAGSLALCVQRRQTILEEGAEGCDEGGLVHGPQGAGAPSLSDPVAPAA